jgi:stage III sporulation protein AB
MQRRMKSDVSFGQAEWNVLMFLGEQLGRTDCNETEKQLRLAVEQLKRIEDTAITDAKRKGKMSIYIGVCGALMMILMCI